MKIIGRVSKIMDLQSGKSAKGEWKKQSVLITQTETDFKDDLLIDFWNDKIVNLEVGKNYIFYLNVKSREYNEKYYTNVSSYKIEPMHENNDKKDLPF
tara:strand:+ start:443 stop:736 length:294 start_codon:yes stop_codon:yes gene_type:complete